MASPVPDPEVVQDSESILRGKKTNRKQDTMQYNLLSY